MLFKQRSLVEMGIDTTGLSHYEQYVREFKEYKLELYRDIAQSFSGGTILDVDAGTGEAGLTLLDYNLKIDLVALESRREFIARCRDQLGTKLNDRWRLVEGRAEHISYRDNYFNGVIAFSAVRRWQDPRRVILELTRVTKKGGLIYLNDLRRNADEGVVNIMLRDWKGRNTEQAKWFINYFLSAWESAYTTEEIEQIVKQLGIGEYSVVNDGPMTHTVRVVNAKN